MIIKKVLAVTAAAVLLSSCSTAEKKTEKPEQDIKTESSSAAAAETTTTVSTTAAAETSAPETTTTTAATTAETTTTTTTKATAAPEPEVQFWDISKDTDSSATIATNTDGTISVRFLDYDCQMTFPSTWHRKFYIENSTVYSYLCRELDAGKGELFSLKKMSGSDFSLNGNETMLLGGGKNSFIVACQPQGIDYDYENVLLADEMGQLFSDLDGIFSKAKCSNTPGGFKPVSLSGFTNPEYLSHDTYFGTWAPILSDWTEKSIMDIGIVQWEPYLCFSSSGTMKYSFGYDEKTSRYIVNDYGDSDVWGICFFDGEIHTMSMYHMILEISNMPKIELNTANGTTTTTTWGYSYWNDTQI